MTIKIPLEVDTSGNTKTVAQLVQIQQTLIKVGKSADSVTALAQSLGTTYSQAKKLAEGINLTADEATKAATGIRVLVAAGANTEERFTALNQKLGITREQFDALEGSVAKYNARQNEIARGAAAIEATLAKQARSVKEQASAASGGVKIPPPDTSGVTQAANEAGGKLDQIGSKAKGAGDVIKNTFSGLGQGIGSTALAFNSIVQSLQLITAAGQQAYQLLIGQNTELQQQLLGTQSTLAATNKVLVNGVEVGDPTKAIKALEGPVNDAIDRVRKGSLDLVGVTSSSLVPLFQTIAGQSANIGASLDQSADLTLSFAAALGTLNIPLDQQRQEINSILTGQITSDSILAKSIGLTNEQVAQYKAQGVLVDKLNEKLAAFKAGNALAAQTIGGVSSNIQELLQEFTRLAGEPLVQPLVTQLDALYQFLQQNKAQIQEFASTGVEAFLSFSESVGESVTQIADTLIPIIIKLGPTAQAVTQLVIQGFQSLAAGIAQITTLLGPALEGATELANKLVQSVQKAQEGFGLLTGATNDSTESVDILRQITAQLGDESIAVQGKIKAATEARNAAQKEGRKLTDEETKAEKAAVAQKAGLVKALEDQLNALNKQVPIGEENRANVEAQKNEIKSRIAALNTDSKALEGNAAKVTLVANKNEEAKDAIKETADAVRDQADAAKLAETKSLTDIANLQAGGAISKEEAEKRKLAAATDRINAELAAEQKGLQALEAQGKNPDEKKEKERQKAIEDSNQKIASLELQKAQQREAIDKASLDRIISANEAAEAKIAASQQSRIQATKQAQLEALKQPGADREKIERDTQAKIEAIQLDTIGKEVNARRKALTDVQAAEKRGEISKSASAEQQKKLNSEIGQLNIQRIDAELAAQKRVTDEQIKQVGIAAQRAKAPLEDRSRSLESQNSALQQQQNLLSAQSSLQQALNGLAQDRLQIELENARANQDFTTATQLQTRLFTEQEQAAQQQNASKLQLIGLQERQKANELQIQRLAEEGKAIDIEAAIKAAELAGKSGEEIDNLRRSLSAQQDKLKAIDNQIAGQSQLNQAVRDQVAAEKAADDIKRAAAQAEQRRQLKAEQLAEQRRKRDEARQEATRKRDEAIADARRKRDEANTKAFSRADLELQIGGATDPGKQQELIDTKRIQDEVSKLNLADKVFSPQDAAALAKNIAGVTNLQDPAQLAKAQQALQLIQAEQQKQQQEADRQADQARAEADRAAEKAQKEADRQEDIAIRNQARAEEQAFQDSLRQAEATFKDGQRQKDLDNAQAIKTVLESTKIPVPGQVSQPNTTAPVRQLFTGGPVTGGEVFMGNERGPEAIRTAMGTHLIGDGTPGLFQAPRSGHVLTARETAALLASAVPGVRVEQVNAAMGGRSNQALLQEIRGLRGDLSQIDVGDGMFKQMLKFLETQPNSGMTPTQLHAEISRSRVKRRGL